MLLQAMTLAILLATGSQNQFLSTWKAPGAEQIDFTGRKVAAVLIVDDPNLRVSAEEALAREISARGAIAVPAYKILPKELLTDKDAARAWFEKARIEGLVILRVVKTDTQKVYSSVVWSSGYYGNAWDYWGTGWATATPIGKGRDQQLLTVETVLYDLSKGVPIWAAATRTTDPKNVQSYMKLLAIDLVKELEKAGLVRTKAR
jgi:hypothetical protein